MCLLFCACGDEAEEKSVNEVIGDAIESYVRVDVSLRYEISGLPTVTHYINQLEENQYEVTGKVTVKDKYGDTYTGKYDAVVDYDPVANKASVDTCDIDQLYKN